MTDLVFLVLFFVLIGIYGIYWVEKRREFARRERAVRRLAARPEAPRSEG